MIIDMNKEERQIFIPNANERAELEKEINKLTLDDMANRYGPYLEFAKKYQLYHIDSKGRKVSPYEISKVFGNGKVLKKDWATFYAILSHPSNIFLFVNELSEKDLAILQNVAINHCMFVKEIEELTGKKMTEERKNRNYYWRTEKAPIPKFNMFFNIGRARGPESRHIYTYQDFFELRKEIRLPLLRTVFRDYLKMETIDSLPQEAPMKTYNAEASIFLNYPILISLFETKQIELGKSKVSATTIKNVEKTCNIEEFFPHAEKDAARLCASIIANTYTLFAATKGTNKERKTEDNIKALFEETLGYMYYLQPAILSHIKGFRRNIMFNGYSCELCNMIQSAVSKYAQNGWLNITDLIIKLRTYNEKAEKYCMILPAEGYSEMNLENSHTGKPINLDGVISNITHPFIKAYLFMMAAYGVVEIAYDEKIEDGDTCYYDTLRYVRLTDLGKYVFGITPKYEHKAVKAKKYFELDDSSLIIKSLDNNNPYLSVLSNMSTAISKNMYKVSYDSFLDGCSSQVDIISKENLFKDYICKEPPANWEEFFKDVKSRCNPMNISKKRYIVMEIPSINKDLQRIILSDPIIRKYSVKAEGYLLLIEVGNRGKVAEALKKYGYLL